MRKIYNWFIDGYVNFMFWWDRSKLEKDLDKELRIYSQGANYEYLQDDTERKYVEGLSVVKNKINSQLKNKNEKEYEKLLENVKEILNLAREETTSQRALRKTLEKMYTRSGKDIKNSKDKKVMIDERIKHYGELKKYNEERALIKKIKRARKEDDEDLAKSLEEEWKNTYGKNFRRS